MRKMAGKIEVHGHCDKKFAAVQDAFVSNFEDNAEQGASFAATVNSKFVVDIWAGYADSAGTRPWQKDTIVNVWSTTKVITALCIHILVDRGLLDLNAPVARYWPEFAAGGKEKIPVKYLLSHTSGLSGWEQPISIADLYDWDRVVGLLANQAPWWEPGTKSGYHSLTFGYPLGELVRRVTGKSLGTFFRDEVATPLNADFHIGFSSKLDSRVAELIYPPVLKPGDTGYLDPQQTAANFPLTAKTFGNPPPFTPEVTLSRAWRAAEIPAANGHGNARSVARVASVIACGGTVAGIKLLSLPAVEKSIEEQIYGTDLALTMPIRWGLGWGLPSKELPISPNPHSCFWGGWGGSLVVMDLDAKLSFAYVMNKMGAGLVGDFRGARLALAVYGALSQM